MKQLIFILLVISSILIGQKKRDELFNEVEIMLDVAKNDNADILCNNYYVQAVDLYNEAISSEKENESPVKTRGKLENSISFLTKMNENIEGKKELFSSVVDKRNTALDSGADKNAQYFWNLGEMKFKEALEDYNDGDIETAKRKLKTIEEYYSSAKLYSNKANSFLDNSNSLAIANSNFANLLAPNAFEHGMDNLSETLEEISSGKRLSDIDKSIAATNLLFDKASIKAVKFNDDYPEVMIERENAKKVDAEKYVVDQWREAEQLLTEAAEEYENQDFEDANKLAMEAREKYSDIKHISLKKYFLNEAEATIIKAENEGAEEFAPITLQKSKDYLDEAKSIIENDSFDLAHLRSTVKSALSSAKNAIYITGVAKKMEPGEQSWEEIILNQQGKDFNEEPKEEDNAPEKSIGVSPLANNFSNELSDDAEIIEKEDIIILRLKNVKFSTMSSKLNKEARASLNKIAEALRKNPNIEAKIVTYTDNIGTKQSNKSLSQKRAAAVYNYIVKRNKETDLTYEGRGESNPIATNSNSAGRNKNRRVEIEILK